MAYKQSSGTVVKYLFNRACHRKRSVGCGSILFMNLICTVTIPIGPILLRVPFDGAIGPDHLHTRCLRMIQFHRAVCKSDNPENNSNVGFLGSCSVIGAWSPLPLAHVYCAHCYGYTCAMCTSHPLVMVIAENQWHEGVACLDPHANVATVAYWCVWTS